MKFTQCGKITFGVAVLSVIIGFGVFASTANSAQAAGEELDAVSWDCENTKSCTFDATADIYTVYVEDVDLHCTEVFDGLTLTPPENSEASLGKSCDWAEPEKFSGKMERETNTWWQMATFVVRKEEQGPDEEGSYKITAAHNIFVVGAFGELGESLEEAGEAVGNALVGTIAAAAFIIGGLICCCAPCCCCQVKE